MGCTLLQYGVKLKMCKYLFGCTNCDLCSKLTYCFIIDDSMLCPLAAVRAELEWEWKQIFVWAGGDGLEIL